MLDLDPVIFDLEPVNLELAPTDWAAVWADLLAWEPPGIEGLGIDLEFASGCRRFSAPICSDSFGFVAAFFMRTDDRYYGSDLVTARPFFRAG